MPSRYPKHIDFDYCLSPLHLRDGEKDVVVPCGRCDGCKVHNANKWAMRLSDEIASCPDSLFVTLTYNNLFLPKLVQVDTENGIPVWSSNHRKNYRFAGNRCSLRDDDIVIVGNYDPIPVTNFDSYPCIPYASKRDIQLWFKLVRKELQNLGLKPNEEKRYFRYFIVSEYGETKFRPHYHAIIFPFSHEIRDSLSASVLYQAWQMCDKDRFDEYCVNCNSSTSGYLTQYLNSVTHLPQVYRCDEVRSFRLASKSPAIGYMSYDREKIFEKIVEGTLEFTKSIERLTDRYIMRYSKDYLAVTFPKCKGYGKKSFDELLFTYGILYRFHQSGIRAYRQDYSRYRVSCDADRLSVTMCSSDYNASRKCLQVCDSLGCTPFHYLYLLDKFWYLNDMYALHMFYRFQERLGNTVFCMNLYTNLGTWIKQFQLGALTKYQILALDLFFESFGVDSLDILSRSPEDYLSSSQPNSDYLAELEDIMSNMVKMPKLNEKLGVSPVNQF